MLRFVYSTIYPVVYPFFFLKEISKKSKAIRKVWLKERFALYDKNYFSDFKRKKIWIHAVSVGEVIAITPLVKALSKEFDIIISVITETGREVALKRFSQFPVKVIFLPIDCPFCIRKALSSINPCMLLIAETEIWPNLIVESAKKIPVALINGRLSERSFKYYKKFSFFFAPILNKLVFIGVQEEIYKQRFQQLGVREDKIIITGNVKFDLEIQEMDFPWQKELNKPVIIAGSTHSPEEEIILNAFLNTFSEGTLILAPRHPQRKKEIEEVIKKRLSENMEFILLSEMEKEKKGRKNSASILIILVDKIGILSALYKICDLAVIGGSFIPHGGQNPLEAIYWKKPVVFGPYMDNFPFIKEFVEKNLCWQVDKDSLTDVFKLFKEKPEEFKKKGDLAYQLFEMKKGASQRTLNLIKKHINLIEN